ncbi:CPBP family glutamic-type intramembrane protease [Flavobacterium sp.]|uniref:CPBP family glutamic-type intramembrane protease n=1 Tax=Flavobacterium sp. TaxID=239 RepID=UPI00345BAB21
MLFFVFSSSFLVKILIYIIDFKEGIKIFNYQNNKLLKYSLWENVSYILLLGPMIEELISRLYLDLKKRSIILTLVCIIIIGLKITNLNFDLKFYFFTFIILIFTLFILNSRQDSIMFFGKKYYSFIFYFSCLTFSFLHFSNYTRVLSDNYIWLLPILVLPQFIMGIFFGYIRIKLGFFWAILLHIFMNIPAVLIYITTKL